MQGKKGIFVALEGIDGAGKSTLVKSITAFAEQHGLSIYTTAEPTKNYIGTHIREILLGQREGDEKTIAALFLADRIDHLTHSEYGILQMLTKYDIVLCDRYYLSSYAYHVPFVSLDWVIEANSICANLRRPDYTFYIDISVEESLKRLSAGREVLDKYETHQRISQVKKNYGKAIEKVKGDENIIIVNGERSQDEVAGEIVGVLKERLM